MQSLGLGGQERYQRVSNSCHPDGCDSVTSVERTFCNTFQRNHEQELCDAHTITYATMTTTKENRIV